MKHGYFFMLLAIVALGAFLRLHRITEIPPGLYPDEAMNGNNALEAIATGRFKVFYPENNGREGLFINLQAFSVAAFGAAPWALRIVSAILGTLTIFGMYLVTKELFRRDGREDAATPIALLASFFLATSSWHLNFSRIGFRAIMLPFMATFGVYFLLKGLRTGKIFRLVAGGAVMGLGFHTYIAYRFMALVAAAPIVRHLWSSPREKRNVALFLFIAVAVALPLGIYFAQNPQDFFNRSSEISVFSATHPIKELGWSSVKTAGMFFWRGDCNWRHNYDCRGELHPLIAFFFLIGIAVSVQKLFRKPITYNLHPTLLFTWLIAMALPAMLTREGLPHALRAIGMIPPVMIFSALGAESLASLILAWFEKQKSKRPGYAVQIERIRREMKILFVLVLLLVPLATYRAYFLRWADHPKTYEAFDASLWHLGKFLAGAPPEAKKYVAVNTLGTPVRGIPMPSQSVMFATGTFTDAERDKKNFIYLAGPSIMDNIAIPAGQKTIIAFLDGSDYALIRAIQKKHPDLKVKVPGDFIILQNY